jgi:hypothetical protein
MPTQSNTAPFNSSRARGNATAHRTHNVAISKPRRALMQCMNANQTQHRYQNKTLSLLNIQAAIEFKLTVY